MTLGLFLATGLAALGDWFAVAQRRFRLEYVLKPLTLLLLVVAAATADLGAGRGWIVAGLVFGLLGDVGLMLSDRRSDVADPYFLLGLGSFLLGHVCYVVGFVTRGVHPLFLLAGLMLVGGISALTLPRVLSGARRAGDDHLVIPVAAYAVVLAVMVICAIGTGGILTTVGALLFLGSDIVLAYDRFVAALARGPLLVIVSYHLGQLLIVLGLLR
jgi:uncharacterized membrane protein YhhN